MPIRKIVLQPAPGTIQIQCFACQKVQTVALDALLLGNVLTPDCITFPLCPCGAMEGCRRTFDAAPADRRVGFPYEHRLAANALANLLKTAGRVAPEQQALVAAETATLPDTIEPDKVDLSAFLPAPKQE
jgi:hypothetical protein